MYAIYDLTKYRQDDLARAAARCRVGARARRPRAARRRPLTTVPVRLLAGIRAHGMRSTSSRSQASA